MADEPRADERCLPAEPWLRQAMTNVQAQNTRMSDGVLVDCRVFFRMLECGPIPPPSIRITVHGQAVIKWENARNQKLTIIVAGDGSCFYRYMIEGPGLTKDYGKGVQVVAGPNIELARRMIAELYPVYYADHATIVHELEHGKVPNEN